MLSELSPDNLRRDKYLSHLPSKAVWCGVAWDCEAVFVAALMEIEDVLILTLITIPFPGSG